MGKPSGQCPPLPTVARIHMPASTQGAPIMCTLHSRRQFPGKFCGSIVGISFSKILFNSVSFKNYCLWDSLMASGVTKCICLTETYLLVGRNWHGHKIKKSFWQRMEDKTERASNKLRLQLQIGILGLGKKPASLSISSLHKSYGNRNVRQRCRKCRQISVPFIKGSG